MLASGNHSISCVSLQPVFGERRKKIVTPSLSKFSSCSSSLHSLQPEHLGATTFFSLSCMQQTTCVPVMLTHNLYTQGYQQHLKVNNLNRLDRVFSPRRKMSHDNMCNAFEQRERPGEEANLWVINHWRRNPKCTSQKEERGFNQELKYHDSDSQSTSTKK